MTRELNYEGFEEYLVRYYDTYYGSKYEFHFKNGYGAAVSAIDRGFRLTILKKIHNDITIWKICDEAPIRVDYRERFTDEEVRNLLKEIQKL